MICGIGNTGTVGGGPVMALVAAVGPMYAMAVILWTSVRVGWRIAMTAAAGQGAGTPFVGRVDGYDFCCDRGAVGMAVYGCTSASVVTIAVMSRFCCTVVSC